MKVRAAYRGSRDRLDGRAFVDALTDAPIRYALEVRHTSFHDRRFAELLRRRRIALCIADTAGVFPDFDDVTADFAYVRLHGDGKLYESGYSSRSLRRWAERVSKYSASGDVFVYFDNDAKVRAPFDARALRAIVRGEAEDALPHGIEAAGEPARTKWPAWVRRA